MVAPRIELGTTSLSARPGQPALDYHVLVVSSPCGSRTQPDWLERPVTSPEVERTVLKNQNESALAQALFRLGDGPRINANDSSRSAHARVKRFITFTPVVDVSIAQQQAVVQRVFWVWLKLPVGNSNLARPAFYSGKQSANPLSGSAITLRRPL